MHYTHPHLENNERRLSTHEIQNERLYRGHLSLRGTYSQFQSKYTSYFIFSLALPVLLFFAGSLFFMNQNYNIFYSLAYDTRPEMLSHLEREKITLIFLAVFSLLASVGLCYWVTRKMIASMIGPLWSMERHLKQVSLGDWSHEDFRTRADDEFQSLTTTYSYLYRSLRAHNQKEIKTLETILSEIENPSPSSEGSHYRLTSPIRNLIHIKKLQLGITNTKNETTVDENVAAKHAARRKRLAS